MAQRHMVLILEPVPSKSIKGNGIVILERNVVSTVGKENKPIAIGETAYEMYEKEPPSIHVSFPLQHGVIAHMQDMIALWNYMNYSLSGKKRRSKAVSIIWQFRLISRKLRNKHIPRSFPAVKRNQRKFFSR